MSVKKSLRIGVVCHASLGGSSVVAVELGLALAQRGHDIHFICSRLPFRLQGRLDSVSFHPVRRLDYPLFEDTQYALTLTSKIVEIATSHALDLLHVHYAVPHATSGILAQQVLGKAAPALVTTLHGTDVTLIGSAPAFLPVTSYSVNQSDGVTVPSRFLAEAAERQLGIARPIEVISNFVDTDSFSPNASQRSLRIVHVSNFRRLKRVDWVVEVFAKVHRQALATGVTVELDLVGDGPERSKIELLVTQLNLQQAVHFHSSGANFRSLLNSARAFLLCSETESFGLAALEALSSGVPVVAFAVGGLPEVITAGRDGFLVPLGDLPAMVKALETLLFNDATLASFSVAARETALQRFQQGPAVDRYEAYFAQVLAKKYG